MSGARGFNTTDGVGTTDSIVLANTTHYSPVTYSFWATRHGTGGGGIGRAFQKGTTADTRPALFVIDSGGGAIKMNYAHPWTTTGEWRWDAFAADGSGHWTCITYDGGATTNAPLVWVDGSSVTVTLQAAPTGSLTTNTEAWVLGNRKSDNARCWDGQIGVFGMWRRALTPYEAMKVSRGYSPLWFTLGLVACVDSALTTDARNAGPTLTGTKVTGGPLVIYPPSAMARWLRVAA